MNPFKSKRAKEEVDTKAFTHIASGIIIALCIYGLIMIFSNASIFFGIAGSSFILFFIFLLILYSLYGLIKGESLGELYIRKRKNR